MIEPKYLFVNNQIVVSLNLLCKIGFADTRHMNIARRAKWVVVKIMPRQHGKI